MQQVHNIYLACAVAFDKKLAIESNPYQRKRWTTASLMNGKIDLCRIFSLGNEKIIEKSTNREIFRKTEKEM